MRTGSPVKGGGVRKEYDDLVAAWSIRPRLAELLDQQPQTAAGPRRAPVRDRVLAGALVVPFVLGTAAAPSHPGHVEFTFRDPDIVESSGLVAGVRGDGLVVTTNDSGDSGRVFTVDPATGETVGVTHWSDDPTDVEALAPAGPGAVWVGDIGDNTASRDSVAGRPGPGRPRRADRRPHDVRPDLPAGAGQRRDAALGPARPAGSTSRPRTSSAACSTRRPRGSTPTGPTGLRPLGPVLPIATDGAFFPDGQHVILRDYSRAVVYTFPGLEPVGYFRLPDQDQGEGLAIAADGDAARQLRGAGRAGAAGHRCRRRYAGPWRRHVPPPPLRPSPRPRPADRPHRSRDGPGPPGSQARTRPTGRSGRGSSPAWLVLGGLVVLVARRLGGRRPRLAPEGAFRREPDGPARR